MSATLDWKASVPFRPRADTLFPQIQEFRSLSGQLDLSEEEELALLQLPLDEWSCWRVLGITPSDPAPDRLSRRLTYALRLLREMASGLH